MRMGHRGLPGGLSLAKLLGLNTQPQRPDLTVDRSWLGPGTPRGPRPLARSQVRTDPGSARRKLGDHQLCPEVRPPRPAGWVDAGEVHRPDARPVPALGPPPVNRRTNPRLGRRHHAAHGRWPTYRCGLIPGTHGEKWHNINASLISGHRGLPGGLTLRKLLAQYRNTTPDPAPNGYGQSLVSRAQRDGERQLPRPLPNSGQSEPCILTSRRRQRPTYLSHLVFSPQFGMRIARVIEA